MIDFDDYLANKLREEQNFPRREHNWHILRKRLEASQITGRSLHGARFWKVAASIALIISSGLAWALLTGRQENAALRRQIAVLESSKSDVSPLLPPNTGNIVFPTAAPGSAAPSETAGSNADKRHSIGQFFQKAGQQAPILPPKADQRITVEPTTRPSFPDIKPQTDTPETEFIVAEPPVSIDSQSVTTRGDSMRDSINTVASTAISDSMQLAVQPGKDTTAAVSEVAIIRPARALSRLRVGMQGSVGWALPREKGISLLTGHGFRAEFALTKNIWLNASVDWLRFDVCTEKFVPRVHHNHHHHPDTLHGSPQSKLVKVESTQRRQQFSLGLRYALPLRTWLKPSVRAAYTWVHGSPETIRFEFKKPMKNDPPEYVVEKNEGGQLSSLLQIGAGVEYVTRDWVFGLWADYSKNLAKTEAGFDALALQAGLLYRFN